MTQQHPITPPPEWVQHWYNVAREHKPDYEFDIATQAARWGADQELEACCEWLINEGHEHEHVALRNARRPKPPSLKEQALDELKQISIDPEAGVLASSLDIIRRALESLPD